IQRPGHKRRTLSRVAIVFEDEAQMLCSVEREIHRAELANGRPIMIDSQARQTARIRLIVIAIPVIVALTVIDFQIIKASLRDRWLTAGIWISAETAGIYRIRVGDRISFFRCPPEKIEFI